MSGLLLDTILFNTGEFVALILLGVIATLCTIAVITILIVLMVDKNRKTQNNNTVEPKTKNTLQNRKKL